MWKIFLRRGLVAGVVALALIQFVPYGRSHTNPTVNTEPAWNQPATAVLARRACFDCHSNETTWPWYSNVAPISWLIQHDVDEGRTKLNFSEWNRPQEGDEIAETIQEGEMPPRMYTVLHSTARLSEQELTALVDGLSATLGSSQ